MECKAKIIGENGRWEKGYYVKMVGGKIHYLFTGVLDITGLYPTFCKYVINPDTLCRFTGKQDISGKDVFEGDIIESHMPDGRILADNMVIKYGIYQSYCPADEVYMDNVGFYVSAPGLPDMPIGPLEDYSKVIGNVFDNPELISS